MAANNKEAPLQQQETQQSDARRRRSGISSASKGIKKVAGGLFSHLGLATVVVLYTVMGGFLFQALEAPHEEKEKLRIVDFKTAKVEELLQLAKLHCLRVVDQANFTDSVQEALLQFQEQVWVAVKNNGWDGKDQTDESALQWSFAGSLLYAVTVVTTIGYGHVAPKTVAGRMITILYALVGIPLTFLYLSIVGDFMARCFRLFYKKVCCGLCIYRQQWTEQLRNVFRRATSADADEDLPLASKSARSRSLAGRRASRPVRVVLTTQYDNQAFEQQTADHETANDVSNGPSEALQEQLKQQQNSVNHMLKDKSTSGGHKKRRKADKSSINRESSRDAGNSRSREIDRYQSDSCRRQEATTSSAEKQQPSSSTVTWSSTARIRRRIVWRRRLSVDSAVESSECWRCKHPVVLTADKIVDATSRCDNTSDVSSDDSDDDSCRLMNSRRSWQHNANDEPKTGVTPGGRRDTGVLSGEIMIDLDQLGFYDQSQVHDMGQDVSEANVTVPISVCLIVIAGYLWVGSMMFTLWENWDYWAGCYFCFVTLSTIGFGDLVPGTDMKEWAASAKLTLCALYLAFGLSMLAMCFNLMQEEVKAKCQWIGRKLGIIKSQAPEADDDDDDDEDVDADDGAAAAAGASRDR